MDPLSALGAGSAVVQFADFSSKLISCCYGAYKSASGASDEHIHLEFVASELRNLTVRLQAYHDSGFLVVQYPQEVEEMKRISGMCHGVASELGDTLDELRVTKSGPLLTWDAVRQAIRSAKKEYAIQNADDRLQRIQSQLTLRLMNLMRHEQASVRFYILEIQRNTDAIQKGHIARITVSTESRMAAMARQERSIEDLTKVVQIARLANTAGDPKLQAGMHIFAQNIEVARRRASTLETK